MPNLDYSEYPAPMQRGIITAVEAGPREGVKTLVLSDPDTDFAIRAHIHSGDDLKSLIHRLKGQLIGGRIFYALDDFAVLSAVITDDEMAIEGAL